MNSLQTAKLSVVDGVRRPNPAEMGEVRARGGTLYVLAEVSAPTATWDSASRQIVTRALQTFTSSQGNETNALQAAADAINLMLLEKNQSLPKEQYIWAGFNVAFVREGHLYLAQAGPALTYIARNGAVTRFPKSFDELQNSPDALMPLGERPTVKCRLAHFRLEPDDLITLSSSHLPTLAAESAIAEAMRGDKAETLVGDLARLARNNDFSAYVIHFEPVSADEAVAAPEAEAEEEWEDEEELAEEWEDELPVSQSVTPPPLAAASAPTQPFSPPREPKASPPRPVPTPAEPTGKSGRAAAKGGVRVPPAPPAEVPEIPGRYRKRPTSEPASCRAAPRRADQARPSCCRCPPRP